MPQYDYSCEDCGARFTIELSIPEHDAKDRAHEVRCPKCKSSTVKHIIEAVSVITSKKS